MNILFFDQPGADEAAIYGGKAASLGRLAATAQVPPGFSIPADAYRSWLESGARGIPNAITVEIRHAYAALEVKSDTKKVAVAVRSSAIDEDGAGDSFAGLHDTYLNICGIDAVIESVVDCWRSLRNQRALEYRESRGFDADSAAMGVVVQQLVNADVSAVAFSANPITGNPDEIVINANYGLGEAVVSGITTPDTVVVSKVDHGQQSLSLGAKEVMTVRTDAGTNERDTPRIMRDQPALSREQATAIADLASLLEDHHGWPVDVECAIQGSNIFLLQCRPITTLPADLTFQKDSTPAGSNALGAEDQEVSHRRRESQPIPVPDDFLFEWDDPADAKLTFTQDKQHMASPMTPLSGWIRKHYWAAGASEGFRALGQPISVDARRINGYFYSSFHPNLPLDQMEQAGPGAAKALKAAMSGFVERWANEWEHELKRHHQAWESFDLERASDSELIDHLRWTLKTYSRIWHIHMEGLIPALVSASMFTELYADLVEGSGQLDAYTLLQGVENESLRAGSDLWNISQAVSCKTRDTLLNTPTAEAMEVLSRSDEGRHLAERINGYLADWGRRSDTVVEFADASWIEDPTIAIDNLKGYLRNPDSDPITRWHELVRERESRVKAVQALIADYPTPVKEQFNQLLVAGQQGQRLQEDHNWWIDQQGTHYVRQVVLEFGNRFEANGSLAGRDDVFMLTGDEIFDAAESGFRGNLKGLAEKRRLEMETWGRLDAPQFVGIYNETPPDNPLTRTMGKFFDFGPGLDGEEDSESDTITGVAGSAGKVRGIARVILRLIDAGRLSPGEILVTVTTSPPWTPLFATAGGVVTDTGGPLSHCAIVAREYGLPATVGTGRATKLISDGQLIEVDGSTGTVKILS